jgi:5'-methylthioadenosine phosphorylase
MNKKSPIGFIGGSGIYEVFKNKKSKYSLSKYGITRLEKTFINERDIFFIPRHGKNHQIPPHMINYRSYIFTLYKLGVRVIFSTSAVGSINPELKPGMFALVNQYIDFTKQRKSTFFNNFKKGIKHTDMTEPYSIKLNHIIEDTYIENNINYMKNLTMIVTEGPRFETPAEIKAFGILGGDIVSMTGYPEVTLARELNIEYASIVICTNYAAGISNDSLSHDEVLNIINRSSERITKIIVDIINKI